MNRAALLDWRPRWHGSALAVAVGITVALSSCGGGADDTPYDGKGKGDEGIPLVTTSGGPPPTTDPAPTSPASGATEPAPSTPADAPSPSGTRPDSGSQARQRPRSFEGRVQADATAMLNVRTMVSIIEGCHSGRESYKQCNTHKELGDPGLLGLEIGKKRGQVQISATDNGFRITGYSMSGAKFTIARGPKGDRFKCIQGRMPGGCPANRVWTF